MKSSLLEAMNTIAEIKDKQGAQVVELAIAFGISRMMASRENAVSFAYTTRDITDFLKHYRVSIDEHDHDTQVTVSRIGGVNAA